MTAFFRTLVGTRTKGFPLIPLKHCIRGGSCFLLLLQLSCGISQPQTEAVDPPRTVDVFTQLTAELAGSFILEGGVSLSDSCTVTFVNSKPDLLFIENAFAGTVRKSSASVELGSRFAAHVVHFEVQPTMTRVRYENASDGGLFGTRRVARSVSLELSARITRGEGGNLLFAGVRQETYRDTIDIRRVEEVDAVPVSVSRAPLPADGFFDRFLGPLVVLAASGVLVYLLFTVRS